MLIKERHLLFQICSNLVWSIIKFRSMSLLKFNTNRFLAYDHKNTYILNTELNLVNMVLSN